MDDDSFSILLQRIAPTIQRQDTDTVLRKAIPAEERLSLTLRYLVAITSTSESLEAMFVCRTLRQSRSVRL